LRDDLAEQAEIVTDAVTDRRNGKRGHALHEACRQSSQAAITQRGIGFALPQIV
jgi:hypothetical protein